MLAHTQTGRYTVIIKGAGAGGGTSARHEAKTRAWFIARKLKSSEALDPVETVELSNAYVQVKYNGCVYGSDVMSRLVLGKESVNVSTQSL